MSPNRAGLVQLIQVLAFANTNGLELAVDAIVPLVAREHRNMNKTPRIPAGYDPNPPSYFDTYQADAYRKVGFYNDDQLRADFNRNKIAYIKRLRELFTLGLKEAKDIAEYRFNYQARIFG